MKDSSKEAIAILHLYHDIGLGGACSEASMRLGTTLFACNGSTAGVLVSDIVFLLAGVFSCACTTAKPRRDVGRH